MPRATVNFTVQHPISTRIQLGWEYDAELCNMLGVQELPNGIKHRLEHLIGACRHYVLRKVPSETERVLVLDAIAKHLHAVVHLLGRPGDAVGGPLASLRRELPGGLGDLRDYQSRTEHVMQAAEKALRTPPAHDLDVSPRAAKVTLAAGLAELLEGYGIKPTTTTESTYLQLVEWALDHVAPKTPGDVIRIASEGLRAWRGAGVGQVRDTYLTNM
jgi:hypothetical protein